MLCPIDNETLVMTERGGVEIDYCPKCRGVWLDRGELDKIIERSAGPVAAAPVAASFAAPTAATAPIYQPEPGPAAQRPDAPRPRGRDEEDDDDHRYGKRYRKRESFLSELFDF